LKAAGREKRRTSENVHELKKQSAVPVVKDYFPMLLCFSYCHCHKNLFRIKRLSFVLFAGRKKSRKFWGKLKCGGFSLDSSIKGNQKLRVNRIIVLSSLQQLENEISGSFVGLQPRLDGSFAHFNPQDEGLLTHLKGFARNQCTNLPIVDFSPIFFCLCLRSNSRNRGEVYKTQLN
jgi:hypothetical protein